jgi:hypothetical protein
MGAAVLSLKRVQHGACAWTQLSHNNIVRVYGTVSRAIGLINGRRSGLMASYLTIVQSVWSFRPQ